MSDEMERFKRTFIEESYELLDDMEKRLIAMDAGSPDGEDLNAIFRCAHSIKGGSGGFGFTALAAFTHELEEFLEGVRAFTTPVTPELIDGLLSAADAIRTLVQAAEGGEENPDADHDALLAQIKGAASGEASPAPSDSADVENLPQFSAGEDDIAGPEDEDSEDEDEDGAFSAFLSEAVFAGKAEEGVREYRIYFKPGKDTLKAGNEPGLMLRELSSLGEMQAFVRTDELPPLQDIDAESAYLSWNIALRCTEDAERIEEVFEFVNDESDIIITEISAGASPVQANAAPKAQAAPAAVTPAVPAPARAVPAAPAQAAKAVSAPAPSAGDVSAQPSTIRVDVDKIDRLVNMVGELVIAQSMVSSDVAKSKDGEREKILQGVNTLNQHTIELQEAVMAVRMQPVRAVFARIPRMLRDLSRKLGKDITLETFGESTELDKTVIERLSDPLVHMIRNSADHGIEATAKQRTDAGKSARGKITLGAEHAGGKIIITIADDGGGINREKVRSVAVNKGLISPEAELSPSEIDNLIFMPGFSTSDSISDVSGRGVGMDVVKKNIESLGGGVQVSSVPGQGTTVQVTLPLTLAILNGMIVRSGNELYVIPVSNILETLQVTEEAINTLPDGTETLRVRSAYLPVISLAGVFGIQTAEERKKDAVISVVIVEAAGRTYGLAVDAVEGQQQVVIKSLEQHFTSVKGVSAATILGDGKVSLILDAAAIKDLPSAGRVKQKRLIAA